MSRKSGQKKRHTKPCRYFQINKCPHSADVCDFAHVIATPLVPLNQESIVCRYHAAGRCNNGQTCKYQHSTEATHSTVIEYWSQSQTDASSYFSCRYPTAYGHIRPSSGFSSCVTCPSVLESILFTPPHSRDSIDTASTSISSLDSDELVVLTNDPQYPEHSHSHQSRVYVEDTSPLIHVPPFYSGGHMNVVSPTDSAYDYGLSSLITGTMQGSKHKPRQQPKPVSKQKALKYKTKPCKFFTTDKGCPNGNTCTFIHDGIPDYSVSPSPSSMSPVKYPSLVEDDKKNYFPITWRVIGGGVRVGVTKESSKNLILHDNGNAFEHSALHNPSQLPPLTVPKRKRSNSIPPTPRNSLFNVEQLFSAESPGVL